MTTLKDEEIQTRGRAELHTRAEVPGDKDTDDQDWAGPARIAGPVAFRPK